jgi:hypothetical protein
MHLKEIPFKPRALSTNAKSTTAHLPVAGIAFAILAARSQVSPTANISIPSAATHETNRGKI